MGITNAENIVSIAYLPASDQALTFSTIVNKVLNVKTSDYQKVKGDYIHFAEGKGMIISTLGDDKLVAMSADGTIELVTVK